MVNACQDGFLVLRERLNAFLLNADFPVVPCFYFKLFQNWQLSGLATEV